MAKSKFVVLRSGTYGKKGEVIALDVKELSERQKVLLKPYKAPVVKGDDGDSEVEKLTAENETLKAEVEKLTTELAKSKPKK